MELALTVCYFVATVHANAILQVHWSSYVSGNETSVVHISYTGNIMELAFFSVPH